MPRRQFLKVRLRGSKKFLFLDVPDGSSLSSRAHLQDEQIAIRGEIFAVHVQSE
jgi:hypothetical protein